jgi:hypothetical protein
MTIRARRYCRLHDDHREPSISRLQHVHIEAPPFGLSQLYQLRARGPFRISLPYLLSTHPVCLITPATAQRHPP